MAYREKYIKYKNKYLFLKNQAGGAKNITFTTDGKSTLTVLAQYNKDFKRAITIVEEEKFESYESQNRIRDILHNSDTNHESEFIISLKDFNILKQQYEIITKSSIEPRMLVKKVADPPSVEQQEKEYEQWNEQERKAEVQKRNAETQFILSYDKQHPRPELQSSVKQYFQDLQYQMYSFSSPEMDKLYKEHEDRELSWYKQKKQAITQFNSLYDTQHPRPEIPASVKKYLEQKERERVQKNEQEDRIRKQKDREWEEHQRIHGRQQENWYYG